MKHLSTLILTALLAVSAGAQTKLIVAFEQGNASQFGYERGQQAVWAEARHHFTPKVEAYLSGNLSNAKKFYIGDGHHVAGSLGARYWFNDWLFAIGGVTVSGDFNSQYSKVSTRASAGAGAQVGDFTGTITAFAPPSDALDVNYVRGATLLIEYSRRIVGPISLYSAGTVSVASFSTTGNPLERFTGYIPKGKIGLLIRLR